MVELSDEYSSSGSYVSGCAPAELSWIEWFCRLEENQFFVQIDEDYIRDDFNLTGLSQLVPHYHKALDIMLDSDGEQDFAGTDGSDSMSERAYEASATSLYGLIHARFILTMPGLQAMRAKFDESVYGHCPNAKCRGQSVLPVGLADLPNLEHTVVYCQSCRETYWPLNERLRSIDGAYFGASFPHLFFMQFPQLSFKQNFPDYYVPRVFGFKVSPECRDPHREITDSASAVGGRQASYIVKEAHYFGNQAA